MANSSTTIYVTNVEKCGHFLKIWGQVDKQICVALEKALLQVKPQFDQNLYPFAFDSLHVGANCIAKYKDDLYYRAKITNITTAHQHLVEVLFLDYGNRDFIALQNLCASTSIYPGFAHIAPQAKEFILANITHHGSEWDDKVINLILNEFRYLEFQLIPVSQIDTIQVIKLMKNSEDIAMSLFSRGIVLSVATSAQFMMLQSYITNVNANNAALMQSSPPLQQPVIGGYKGNPLETGSEHPVYISYVSDGPCDFYIQLQKMEENLIRLMQEINRMNLVPLEDTPVLPGTVCVARCEVDDHICRAVVTNMVDGQYKVFYVDFGNSEVLAAENLFNIPFRFVIPKVMAMRYSLAGLERQSVTVEMKCAFKNFVNEKLLRMRVIPAPTKSSLPQCVLWDQSNGNVLDVLKQAALMAYPDPLQLSRGFTHDVTVCCVISCNRFYVQLKSKQEDLGKLMLDLQEKSGELQAFSKSDIVKGLPCCAYFHQDQQWYRGEVIKVHEDKVDVSYIDYGNVETVPFHQLRKPKADMLTSLRPQALECCLNGYQNMQVDLERDTFLEQLVLEKECVMKVIEMQGNRALVDLIDNTKYNIASRLLEKIAAAHSQVSPLLVQENNHIEQRKSRPSPNRNHQESRPFREEKGLRRESNRESDKRQPNHNMDSSRPNKGRNQRDENDDSSEDNWRKPTRKMSDHFETRRRNDFNNQNDFSNRTNENNFESTNQSIKRTPPRRNGEEMETQNQFDNKRPQRRNDSRLSNDDSFGSDRGFNRKQENGAGDSFDKPRKERMEVKIDFAPKSTQFTQLDPTNSSENVNITWFHHPGHFYCQLEKSQNDIRMMMEDIQKTYPDCKPVKATVDSCCIALFKEDRVLYRAKVLEVLSGFDCKVQYVDFGNVAVTNKVWPLAKKFVELPIQSIRCGLKDISPIGENWEKSDQFSSYFDKETFLCSFDSKEDDTCLVNLECDNKNVGEELVTAGLAKYSNEEPTPNIPLVPLEVPLLVFQTLLVTVTGVESLQDFTICLESGHEIHASLHNLADATTTYEDVFRQWMNTSIVAYVDNVIDDKLEVTFYDIEGNKLNFIEPDAGAFETIELPCALPVLSSNLTGWVSSITTNSIYVQPDDYPNKAASLLEKLTKYYKENQVENVTPEEGLIYVIHSSDNYYRVRVKEVKDDLVSIVYLDYGNYDEIPPNEFKSLHSDFYIQHLLALEVFVNDPEAYNDQTVNLQIRYGESGWEEAVDNVAEEPQVKTGISVVLSHLDSPNEFYLQLLDASEQIDLLQEKLQIEVPEFPTLDNPVAGVLCAAPYSIDQQWYRAQVLDADGEITTVRFVDYGNTDVLTNDTKVKTLSAELLAMEQHARKYSLVLKSVADEWSQAAHARFEELTTDKDLHVEIIHQDDKTTYVELFAGDDNIAEILIQEGFAEKVPLQVETSSTGYISHLNSPSEFWIQLESSVPDLEWVAEQLATASTFPELDDLTPGSLCAALFPDDELWYRARILSNTVAGLEVLFIDYGNSCNCSGLRQLPEELVLTPPLAQKSSLQKPAGYLQWPVFATDKFKEISADGATVFTIKKLSLGETTVVELLLDGQSFIDDLLPVTEPGHISKFESISDFIVVKESDGMEVKCEMEPLPGFKWNDNSSEQLSSLINQGTKFQVEMVSENSVRLYVNGQDVRVKIDATSLSAQSTPRKRLNALAVSPTKSLNDDLQVVETESVSETQFTVSDVLAEMIDNMEVTEDDKMQVEAEPETEMIQVENTQEEEPKRVEVPQIVISTPEMELQIVISTPKKELPELEQSLDDSVISCARSLEMEFSAAEQEDENESLQSEQSLDTDLEPTSPQPTEALDQEIDPKSICDKSSDVELSITTETESPEAIQALDLQPSTESTQQVSSESTEPLDEETIDSNPICDESYPEPDQSLVPKLDDGSEDETKKQTTFDDEIYESKQSPEMEPTETLNEESIDSVQICDKSSPESKQSVVSEPDESKKESPERLEMFDDEIDESKPSSGKSSDLEFSSATEKHSPERIESHFDKSELDSSTDEYRDAEGTFYEDTELSTTVVETTPSEEFEKTSNLPTPTNGTEEIQTTSTELKENKQYSHISTTKQDDIKNKEVIETSGDKELSSEKGPVEKTEEIQKI